MKTPRNDPCPCGSGRKYKKCCLTQDQQTAHREHLEQRRAEQARIEKQRAEDEAFNRHLLELNELSNQAIEEIENESWEEARHLCAQLLEQYPEDIDGHDRFAFYYRQRGDFQRAKQHAQAGLEMARQNPDKFYDEVAEGFLEELDYLEKCIQAGRRV